MKVTVRKKEKKEEREERQAVIVRQKIKELGRKKRVGYSEESYTKEEKKRNTSYNQKTKENCGRVN